MKSNENLAFVPMGAFGKNEHSNCIAHLWWTSLYLLLEISQFKDILLFRHYGDSV